MAANRIARPVMELAIVAFLIFVTTGIGLYRWQRRPSSESREAPYPRDFGGLFPAQSQDPGQKAEAEELAARKAAELREELLARAGQGDLSCLSDAQAAGRADLYNEVLNALGDWSANCHEKLQAIVSYIVKHPELRANKGIAKSLVTAWLDNPSGYAAAEVVH